MIKDIRNLSSSDKIQRLILETALRYQMSQQSMGGSENDVISDDELFELFRKIEHRVYYTTESPKFTFEGSNFTCLSMGGKDISTISEHILADKYKFYVFYNVYKQSGGSSPIYIIRGYFIDDPQMLRHGKINQVLDEEE